MSLPRAIGSLTDFTDSLLRAVGQPTIFGTPLVVRQRIKYSLSTAKWFGQNLNLMCVLIEVYISGRPWPTAIIPPGTLWQNKTLVNSRAFESQ